MEFMKNGKRIDDRLPNELRPIKFEVGPLERADGSCYVEHGGNKIIAAVYGPRAGTSASPAGSKPCNHPVPLQYGVFFSGGAAATRP